MNGAIVRTNGDIEVVNFDNTTHDDSKYLDWLYACTGAHRVDWVSMPASQVVGTNLVLVVNDNGVRENRTPNYAATCLWCYRDDASIMNDQFFGNTILGDVLVLRADNKALSEGDIRLLMSMTR